MRRALTIWLDDRKHEHADLVNYSRELKKSRQFAATIRDGLRLIRDLRNGNLTVLIELFPWIEGALLDAIEAAATPSGDDSGNGSNGEVLARLDALQRSIEAQQLPGSTYQQAPALVSGNLSGLKPAPAPADDDDLLDLLEVRDVSDTGGQAAQNFINSMLAMQASKSEKPAKPASSRARVPDASEIVVMQATAQ